MLVLALKWALVLKYSKVCLLFCNGYSKSAFWNTSISLALTSKSCPLPSDLTRVPFTLIVEAIESLETSSKFASPSSKTIWTPLKNEPSLVQ